MKLTAFQINALTVVGLAAVLYVVVRRAVPEGGELKDGAISLTRFTPIGALADLFKSDGDDAAAVARIGVPEGTRFGAPTFLDVAAGTQADAGEIAAGRRKKRRDG